MHKLGNKASCFNSASGNNETEALMNYYKDLANDH